jgi:TonB family protein
MSEMYQNAPFSLLPDRRPPWKQFVLTMGLQGLALFVFAWAAVLNLAVLDQPVHDYHFIRLVETPPPEIHEPAPVREIPPPRPVAQVETPQTPPAEVLRVPPPEVKPKAPAEEVPVAPKVEIAATKPVPLPPAAPVIPKQLVKTHVFSTGSSALPTIAAAPKNVQTGGFGDPNGVPARDSNAKAAVNIAPAGSFDLPTGPGYGNGTGGAKGVRGVVASTGFGSGIATGDGSGKVNTSRGNGIQKSGFGDTQAVSMAQLRPKQTDDSAGKMLPAEIISKPTPAYTPEARNLRIEGEVVLEVVFEATGKLRVVRVVQGLGHGLDETATRAAEQIRFKPAKRDGQPSDYTALVHIVFQLA